MPRWGLSVAPQILGRGGRQPRGREAAEQQQGHLEGCSLLCSVPGTQEPHTEGYPQPSPPLPLCLQGHRKKFHRCLYLVKILLEVQNKCESPATKPRQVVIHASPRKRRSLLGCTLLELLPAGLGLRKGGCQAGLAKLVRKPSKITC